MFNYFMQRQIRTIGLLISGIVLGVITFGIIYAQGSGVVSACVNSYNGNARIVGAASDCRNPEYYLEWNVSGPTGPQGDPGPTGPQGTHGHNALISTTPIAAGAICAKGGVLITAGTDNGDGGGTAGDNVLQPGEIDVEEVLCNGEGTVTTSSAISALGMFGLASGNSPSNLVLSRGGLAARSW